MVTADTLSSATRRMAVTCTCFHLRRAARAVTHHYDQALRPLGIRATHLTILSAVSIHAGTNLSDLARILVLEPSALSRNVALLKRKRLVRARRGADRRARSLELTDAGRTMVARAYPLWLQAQTTFEQAVPADALKRGLGFLDEVTNLALSSSGPPSD